MVIPQVETYLPELMTFVDALAHDYEKGTITSWPIFFEPVRSFYTPETMAEIDAIIPTWRAMAECANGTTLIHVTSVLTALLLCPEYQSASPDDQTLLKWIVLFHDVAKRISPGKRDFTHGFRSGAVAGKALKKLGFVVQQDYDKAINDWYDLTFNAIVHDGVINDDIHDNTKLPQIMDGIRQLFGWDTPASLVVACVLFHMSINTVQEYPQTTPLCDDEICAYISPTLAPLLQVMNTVDNDGWAFFDPDTKTRHRSETLQAFARVNHLISHKETS